MEKGLVDGRPYLSMSLWGTRAYILHAEGILGRKNEKGFTPHLIEGVLGRWLVFIWTSMSLFSTFPVSAFPNSEVSDSTRQVRPLLTNITLNIF